jgi:hypothetical protein
VPQAASIWAASTGEEKDLALATGSAIVQLSLTLSTAAALFLFGIGPVLYGVALVASHSYPSWVGWAGVVLGTSGSSAAVACPRRRDPEPRPPRAGSRPDRCLRRRVRGVVAGVSRSGRGGRGLGRAARHARSIQGVLWMPHVLRHDHRAVPRRIRAAPAGVVERAGQGTAPLVGRPPDQPRKTMLLRATIVSGVVGVAEPGYRPSSVDVRGVITDTLFTARIRPSALAGLDQDPRVVSIELGSRLDQIDQCRVSQRWPANPMRCRTAGDRAPGYCLTFRCDRRVRLHNPTAERRWHNLAPHRRPCAGAHTARIRAVLSWNTPPNHPFARRSAATRLRPACSCRSASR